MFTKNITKFSDSPNLVTNFSLFTLVVLYASLFKRLFYNGEEKLVLYVQKYNLNIYGFSKSSIISKNPKIPAYNLIIAVKGLVLTNDLTKQYGWLMGSRRWSGRHPGEMVSQPLRVRALSLLAPLFFFLTISKRWHCSSFLLWEKNTFCWALPKCLN